MPLFDNVNLRLGQLPLIFDSLEVSYDTMTTLTGNWGAIALLTDYQMDGPSGSRCVSLPATPSYLSCFDVRLLREAGDLAGAIRGFSDEQSSQEPQWQTCG